MFLNCFSTDGANGIAGFFRRRNILCETNAKDTLFSESHAIPGALNNVCPVVNTGDIFDVYTTENKTESIGDFKFKPENQATWGDTQTSFTCVYTKKNEHSDRLEKSICIPHLRNQFVVFKRSDNDEEVSFNFSTPTTIVSAGFCSITGRVEDDTIFEVGIKPGADTVARKNATTTENYTFAHTDIPLSLPGITECNLCLTLNGDLVGVDGVFYCVCGGAGTGSASVEGETFTFGQMITLSQADTALMVSSKGFDRAIDTITINVQPVDNTNVAAKPKFGIKFLGRPALDEGVTSGSPLAVQNNDMVYKVPLVVYMTEQHDNNVSAYMSVDVKFK